MKQLRCSISWLACTYAALVLAADARTGVCITGQARSFALIGVRRSLRKMLDALPGPVIMHMVLARHTTHLMLAKSPSRHARAGHAHTILNLTEHQIREEFPEAREIELFNDSSCEGLPYVANRSCCKLRREIAAREAAGEKFEHDNYITKSQPVAFLQYANVDHCIETLLTRPEARTMDHVIRARPDLLYLDTVPILEALHKATDLPIAMRRAWSFGMGQFRFQLWDWFVILPIARAREVVHSWISHMDEECTLRGRARYAYDARPEITWMAKKPRPQFGVHTLPIGIVESPTQCSCPWIDMAYPNCSRNCVAEYRRSSGTSPLQL